MRKIAFYGFALAVTLLQACSPSITKSKIDTSANFVRVVEDPDNPSDPGHGDTLKVEHLFLPSGTVKEDSKNRTKIFIDPPTGVSVNLVNLQVFNHDETQMLRTVSGQIWDGLDDSGNHVPTDENYILKITVDYTGGGTSQTLDITEMIYMSPCFDPANLDPLLLESEIDPNDPGGGTFPAESDKPC